MKTVEEIKEAASRNYQADYHGPTESKNGYTYIPWDRAVDLAIQIFGIDGFDVEVVKQWREEITSQEGITTFGYGAIVRVRIWASDLERPLIREGLGFNEMTFTKTGIAQIDAAIKGAASGALLRALVLLGDAFGLYLYTGATPSTPTPSGGSAQPTPARSSGKGPTEGQIPHLLKNFSRLGLTEGHIKAMSYETAKALLDGIWRDKKPAQQVLTENGFTFAPPKGDGLPIPAGSR